MTLEWLAVCTASLLAGMVDAMVGGGGLLTVPALFSSYPTLPPALLLGTNKSASVCGTLVAAWRYCQAIHLRWSWLIPAALVAFSAALVGAWSLTWLDAALLSGLCPLLLAAMLAYTLWQPTLGLTPVLPRDANQPLTWLGLAAIGWYDGFFGPGTGSLLIFLLVRQLGLDFLQASGHAKVLNAATNLAALLLLAAHGQVWWQVGLTMALANMVGNLLGTRLALRHGAALVRKVFVSVVLVLIVKTAWDAYTRMH